jgi:hypothetical protein
MRLIISQPSSLHQSISFCENPALTTNHGEAQTGRRRWKWTIEKAKDSGFTASSAY